MESKVPALPAGYVDVRSGIAELLYAARRVGARSVNALMTANYWAIGRRIVQAEQKGKRRAGYGEQLIVRLLSVKDDHARHFYEVEALRGGWSVRIDQTWYRVDLLLFHRRLRCLVIIDLKLSSLTHADVGQMYMCCNYAKENWTLEGENSPVGLILCADKGHALAWYALDELPNKIMAANYKTVLPDAEVLQKELEKTRLMLESRGVARKKWNSQ